MNILFLLTFYGSVPVPYDLQRIGGRIGDRIGTDRPDRCGGPRGTFRSSPCGGQQCRCHCSFARRPLTLLSRDVSEMTDFNSAMSERFKTRFWTRPLPRAGRVPDFPRCGHCFAKFILDNVTAAPPPVPLQVPALVAAPAVPPIAA